MNLVGHRFERLVVLAQRKIQGTRGITVNTHSMAKPCA
jgi:hypothetical protein